MNGRSRVVLNGVATALWASVAAISVAGCTTAPPGSTPVGDARSAAIRASVDVEASIAAVVKSERAAKAAGVLKGDLLIQADTLVDQITEARHTFEALERAGVNPSTANLVSLVTKLTVLIPKGY